MKNNTVFVLLMGGKSERMGTPKGLLEYQNSYWILEQIERIATTSISEVYIGLGYHSEEYLNRTRFILNSSNRFATVTQQQISNN
jgi:molybdopterin-guanine dinucleotide biosynthesis protein A